MDGNSTRSCPHAALNEFSKRMEKQMWQVNGLMLLNAIVMGFVVLIGVYAPRYRRHPFIGFIFQGANTLFLPIVSIVAGTATLSSDKRVTAFYFENEIVTAGSIAVLHNFLILVWTGLVIFVGISTSAVVAGDPREGRNIEPSTELLIKAIWAAYLMVGALVKHNLMDDITFAKEHVLNIKSSIRVKEIFTVLIAINLCKIYQKYRVFYVARESFILGRNPRLIISYMAHLDGSQDMEQAERHVVPPPSLIVMEGVPITLEQQPVGYSYKFGMLPGLEHQQSGIRRIKRREGSELVTFDRVWGLDDNFLRSTPQAKDLCFSFALFKLLRCRFAKYTVSEAGFTKARNFFWHTYLLQGADYSRVFRVIADELSFLHDYYYSSMSIPFFHRQFLLTRVFNQVLSIGFCSYIFVFISQALGRVIEHQQVIYVVTCVGREGKPAILNFGYMYYDVVPVCLVLAAILFSEIRETVSFFCSKFTKVVLICNYVINTRWPVLVAFVFKHLRCKWLLDPWDDKMSQCKLLVLHPRKVSILVRRCLRLPNQRKVKVPSEVKEAIFKALQGLASEQQGRALEHIRLPWSPISSDSATGTDAQSACGGKGAADTILAWHIATTLFEVKKHPVGLGCKTAAVRLSHYCAYLVGYHPELLPDDAEWCQTLHKAVSDDAGRVLAATSTTRPGADEFQRLVALLEANSKHEVLRHGANLAKELVGTGTGWEALARFWSEMILYVAPSENLDAHADAISRGGELITLVWALLAHAGIVGRLDAAASTDAAAHV